MAHIKFRTGSAALNGVAQLIVDDRDLTLDVLADGFEIGTTGAEPFDEWYVQIRLAAESLDLDLPDSVVRVIREGGES